MKEEVELKKEDIRNMTMIMNSPEMLMNLSMQHNGQVDPNIKDSAAQNILDELEENGNNSGKEEGDEENHKEGNH